MTLCAGDYVEVVGESYRQDTLKRLAARTTNCEAFLADLSGYAKRRAEQEQGNRWFRAALMLEPNNPVDENAIAVYADGVGHVGYLNRDDAIDYAPIFPELNKHGCAVGSVPAFLIGGEPGKPFFGVLLCLSSPDEVVRDLAAS
jgi:hypothetical protein